MHEEIIKFWFDEIGPAQYWKKDKDFDALLVDRFSALHAHAVLGELYTWRAEPEGRLAEIIVLDQFSRNMFRDSALAFANDSMSLALAQEAVAIGADESLEARKKIFLYMPFMHSESLQIHELAVKLFSQPGLDNNLDFEHKHKRIIERFGRYPHRNEVLGRQSTPDEIEFLAKPDSGF
jgi:uncharacterized protein (DUF924 family)